MAEVHVEQLGKIDACPLCGAGDGIQEFFYADLCYRRLSFPCGLTFEASTQSRIVANSYCLTAHLKAVAHLNMLCEEVANG